jgi:hypothetical protein
VVTVTAITGLEQLSGVLTWSPSRTTDDHVGAGEIVGERGEQ